MLRRFQKEKVLPEPLKDETNTSGLNHMVVVVVHNLLDKLVLLVIFLETEFEKV
ncbi:Uncharacterised protein [Chlamydia trachomatis]|nr:Uncharacterised protein [Chlamydia trachomatis]CRH56769.1 Uncharacterised protein [Chlamydia trachomatis]